MTKKKIYNNLLKCRESGSLYPVHDEGMNGVFWGSLDRFSEIAIALSGKHKILDVGSGNGILMVALKQLGHEVHGIDIEDYTYLDIYKEHDLTFKLSNAEVDTLPFEDESFYAITCCQVLEHFT
tara:strand:- start:1514 stop:1885 length:372 start_codon:yes stop_codon:yes gene_type:complete